MGKRLFKLRIHLDHALCIDHTMCRLVALHFLLLTVLHVR